MKHTVNRIKRQAKNQQNLCYNLCYKRLVFKIYKELFKFNNKKKQQQINKWAKDLNTSLKNIYIWQISI